jgi:hypothetical protein
MRRLTTSVSVAALILGSFGGATTADAAPSAPTCTSAVTIAVDAGQQAMTEHTKAGSAAIRGLDTDCKTPAALKASLHFLASQSAKPVSAATLAAIDVSLTAFICGSRPLVKAFGCRS